MSWIKDVGRATLPNGLTALVQRAPSAPVVAVVTHVRAGYFDEPNEWVGIAHVLEHMFFKGTDRRGPGDIARETQQVGGYINAGTIYDKTVYFTVLPTSDGGLGQALDVQSDALRNAAIDGDELSRELEVIIQEAKRKLDTPAAVTYETLLQLLFKTHRIRRWRIGTEEGLRKLTRDDVVAYYESRYTPDRTIVSVVGDVDVTEAMDLIHGLYDDWDRSPQAFEASPAETGAANSGIRIIEGDVKRARASLGWRTVGPLHPDAPGLDVAAGVLGSGRGSHLYRHIRQKGIATGTSADHYTPTEVGVFSVGLEADLATFDEALSEAVRCTVALRLDAVTDEDIARVRSLMRTRWLGRLESMEGRASALCEAEALGGIHLMDEFYDRFMQVTRDDVVAVAAQYFDASTACIAAFLPEGSTAGLSADWSQPGSAHGDPTPVNVPEIRIARSSPGAADVAEVAPGIFHVSHATFDVILREKRGTGLVTLGLHFPGIPSWETEANAGITTLGSRTALRGAGGLSGDELVQLMERLGGTVTPTVRVDHMGWWLTVPNDRVAEAASILRVIAEQPNPTDDDIDIERQLLASDARRRQDDMFGYPVDRVLQEVFLGHHYGRPVGGSPESILNIETPALREWARRVPVVKPVVIAVGDASPEALASVIEPLAVWSDVQPGHPEPDPPSPKVGRGQEQRVKQQSALAMAFPAYPFDSPKRFAMVVTGSVLSGLAGRLFDELREKRALAYTVAAFPWLGRHAGVMLTYIATSPEREDEARDAMLGELRRLVVDPPDGSELDRARNYAAGSIEMRLQSGRSMADEVLQAWMKGAIEDVPFEASRMRAVTRDDVVEVAESVFAAKRRAEFVVRGASTGG